MSGLHTLQIRHPDGQKKHRTGLGLESPSYEQDQPRPPSKPAPRVHSSPRLCGAV